MFIHNQLYTREDIWNLLFPKETYQAGGEFDTEYLSKGGFFIIFSDVTPLDSTESIYPNRIINSGELEWFGKPNAHSAQVGLNSLLVGNLKPLVFIRYDSAASMFFFYGVPRIKTFRDNCIVNFSGKLFETIKITFCPRQSYIPERLEEREESEYIAVEGARVKVFLNRYERDPILRKKCTDLFGYDCAACGFSFSKKYGRIGIDYCHVHHLKPLSELGGISAKIDPTKDLIPLCANCHAIVHRVSPALTLTELKALIVSQSEN